jgi:hypothetical protein
MPGEAQHKRPSNSRSTSNPADFRGGVDEAQGGLAPARHLHHLVVATMAAICVVIASSAGPAEAEEDGSCRASDEEYSVVASVAIRNTLLGAANGVYPMGSGKLTIHLDDHAVKLTSYNLTNQLTVRAKVAMLSATVVTASRTSTAGDCCHGSAHGTLSSDTLTWNSTVSGYHSEGSLTCSGSMCGTFGAPPSGTSTLHDTPGPITFNPFTFSPDGSTFTMPYVLVSQSSSPRQKTYLALSGRRVRRTCGVAAVPTCCLLSGEGRGGP